MNVWIGLLLTVGVMGCDAGPEPVAVPEPVVEPAPEPDGAARALRPGAVVLLGEMHGTVEAPRLVGELAEQALDAGLTVRVGLEIPEAERERIHGFVSSGSAETRSAMLAGEFWQREAQDGRSSVALVDLIARVGRLAREGRAVGVDVFDGEVEQGTRDAAMAERVAAAVRANPGAVHLILTGNIHARTQPGVPWDAAFVPMGKILIDAGLDVVALDTRYGEGAAWNCQSDGCAAHPLSGGSEAPYGTLQWLASPNEQGFTGTWAIGSPTPSPPAVE